MPTLRKEWLIRKAKSHYIGPFDTEFVKKLLQEAQVSGYDEIARSDGSWRYIKDCPAFSEFIEDLSLTKTEEKTVNLSIDKAKPSVIELQKKKPPSSFRNFILVFFFLSGTIVSIYFFKPEKKTLTPLKIRTNEEDSSSFDEKPLEALSEAFEKFNISFFQAKLEESAGNIDKAISLYQEALSLKPPLSHEVKIKIRLLALQVETREKSASQARLEFLKLLTIPKIPKSYTSEIKNYLGILELKEKQFSKATSYFQEVIQQDEQFSPAYFNVGFGYFHQKQFYEARKYFERAVQLHPSSPMMYVYLGRTLEKLNKQEEALAEYLNAHRINSHLQFPYVYLSAMYLKKNQRESAFSYLSKMLKEDPDYDKNMFQDFRFIQEEPDFSFLIKTLEKEKASAIVYNSLGLLKGKTWVQKALQMKEQEGTAHTLLGYYLQKEGDLEKALTQLKAALRFQYQNSLTHTLIADVYIRLGRYQEAIEHCRKVLGFDPFYVKAYYLLGVALAHQERISEAQDMFNKALEYDPNYMPAKRIQIQYSQEK